MNYRSDSYHQMGAIQAQIENEKAKRADLRRWERHLGAAEQQATVQTHEPAGDAKSLFAHLRASLPAHLVPGNVGPLYGTQWPEWEVFNFDFGTDPLLTAATRQSQRVQITQEAGFLAMALCWAPFQYDSTSGFLGPWTIERITDVQSSRQFNNDAIPLQIIGNRSNPTVLPTPMYFSPNAFIELTLGVRLPEGTVQQATVGSSQHQITLFGYRARTKNEQQTLSSVFK